MKLVDRDHKRPLRGLETRSPGRNAALEQRERQLWVGFGRSSPAEAVIRGPSGRPRCVGDRSAVSSGHRHCWLACDRF